MTAAHTVTSNDNNFLEEADAVRVWFPKEDAFNDLSKLKPNMTELYHSEIVESEDIFVYREYEKFPSDVRGTDAALIHVKGYKHPIIYPDLRVCLPDERFLDIDCTVIGFPCESDNL